MWCAWGASQNSSSVWCTSATAPETSAQGWVSCIMCSVAPSQSHGHHTHSLQSLEILKQLANRVAEHSTVVASSYSLPTSPPSADAEEDGASAATSTPRLTPKTMGRQLEARSKFAVRHWFPVFRGIHQIVM